MTDVAIIGGGPAGLFAAERLARAGQKVDVFDRMPTLGRKLLMAGRGGLNLTHSEDLETFLTRYGASRPHIEAALRAFPPDALREWAAALGEETFAGSSGRVFPKSFKASPLLRAWLRRLGELGVTIHTRNTWTGWDAGGALRFETVDGAATVKPGKATLLALGGASWPRLGADGGWTNILAARGVAITPLQPANSGVLIAWSDIFRDRFAGQPLKRVKLSAGGVESFGEAMVTQRGLEGGAIYALSASLRQNDSITIDLKPELTAGNVTERLAHTSRRGETLTNLLRKALALSPVQTGLLREAASKDLPRDPEALAALVKSATLKLDGIAGLERAISTAGGISFSGLTENFELKGLPGVFAAGEMLDWEAPTGGYLLQACFATGAAAAAGILTRR